ncbi:hypothetical protein O3M35_004810 [Rhynocoris fuscipes]|uniref:Mesoderm induction early response protein 1 n=1 Tax=Rhynocoris fuscipes TaxID=488301 RepID=A0AAW1DG91_9HEMI
MDVQENIYEEVPIKRRKADVEFTPPVDMMVHDYDDEQTLEEEEALGPLEDPQVELSSLEKEGNMPLEDLMAMYGYKDPDNINSSDEMNGDKSTETESTDKKSEPSELEQLYNDAEAEVENETNVRATRYGSRHQSEDEDDYEFSPGEEDKKKTIMVGSDYQAWIPEVMCKYDDALPYENEDKLVWDPNKLLPKEIEDYLIKAQESIAGNNQGVSAIPMGKHTRDDEEALYLLLQCGYNVEEALRRRRINAVPANDSMSLWSEEECRHFENGLRHYGKDFRQIQQNKVKTRSVGELVQFYYLWKKTERHDIFANKARLEKKKYALHPGITDYMDRFLEEQEGGAGTGAARDRSTSPNIHSLLYGDPKWQRTHEGQTEATETTNEVKPKIEITVENSNNSEENKNAEIVDLKQVD